MRNHKRHIPNFIDYDDDFDRADNYGSIWCRHCKAYSALSCSCWKKLCYRIINKKGKVQNK